MNAPIGAQRLPNRNNGLILSRRPPAILIARSAPLGQKQGPEEQSNANGGSPNEADSAGRLNSALRIGGTNSPASAGQSSGRQHSNEQDNDEMSDILIEDGYDWLG